MIPIELEKQIIAGTLEYAIHRLVEERVKIDILLPQIMRGVHSRGKGLIQRNGV